MPSRLAEYAWTDMHSKLIDWAKAQLNQPSVRVTPLPGDADIVNTYDFPIKHNRGSP